MVEWNGIFGVFRFSGILGQPREVHPKFRNEIPENDCSIRSPSRNFRNFWSNGKRPISLSGMPTTASSKVTMTTILSQRKAGPGNETLTLRKEQTSFYDRFRLAPVKK